MAPSQPTHTHQTTKVELPEWVERGGQENYDLAKQISQRPHVPYAGQTVAGVNDDMTNAFDMFRQTMGTGSQQVGEADDLFSRVGQGIAGMDRSIYMNPFTDEVENKALGALDRQRQTALMGNSDKARAAGAFGGSRHGIVDAVTNAESAQSAGLLSADLRQKGFDNATSQMLADLQNAGNAAQGKLGAASQMQQNRMQDFTGLLGIGQQGQMQEQRVLDDQYRRWMEAQNHDVDMLNLRLSALGMSPYGKSESTDKVTSGGSSGTDLAMLGGGILQLLPVLFGLSDREAKTDIKKAGKDPKTGIPLYSYRYKGDPKTYPKVVGPMAQDIEKVMPEAVGKIGGVRVVDNRVLGALSNA